MRRTPAAILAGRLARYGYDFYGSGIPDMNRHRSYENIEDYFA